MGSARTWLAVAPAVVLAIAGGCSSTVETDAGPPDAPTPDAPQDARVAPMDAGIPVFVSAAWQVDCDTMMPACTRPFARRLDGVDGMGATVSCTMTETADSRVVSFDIGASTGGVRYGASVTGARVPRGGGMAASAGCSFSVLEGTNRYTGACGGAPPSDSQPCQVGVVIANVDPMTGRPTASVEVICDHLRDELAMDERRSVHLPADTSTPAFFFFYDCVGQSVM